MPPPALPLSPAQPPTFGEAFRFWLKLGWISFGGPTGQIAIMQSELVDRRKWISQSHFLHALNYCMLLPGPEAQQLAIYIGWLLHRTVGGIVAGTFFVLPSVFILWTLSFIYVRFGAISGVAGVFYGLKAAVLAIVAHALLRIAKKALKGPLHWAVALASFVAIYFFHAPFPAIILTALALGFLSSRFQTKSPTLNESAMSAPDSTPSASSHTRPTLRRAINVSALWLLIWWGPIAAVLFLLGPDHTLFRESLFFAKAAVVTFGGAYAVLPYVAQEAVEKYQWLTSAQMLDGLGLAETTPGPLIMVLQFVGFVGAWHYPGNLSPLMAATFGALLTTWVTFTPCFLWVFLGGPHIEQLRNNQKLSAALSTVTAAVVGVILNLALWFGISVLHPNHLDWFSLAVCLVAFVGMERWKWGVIPVVAGSAILGFLYHLAW